MITCQHTPPRRRRRRSYAERQILDLLRSHPTGRISYDNMEALTDFDRRTLITAMARLRATGQIRLVEAGRGSVPNRYLVI